MRFPYDTSYRDSRKLLRYGSDWLAYGALLALLVAAPWVLPAGLVVLKGLAVDTALAVDSLPRTALDAGPPPRELDLAVLAAHGAFQPGACVRGVA